MNGNRDRVIYTLVYYYILAGDVERLLRELPWGDFPLDAK